MFELNLKGTPNTLTDNQLEDLAKKTDKKSKKDGKKKSKKEPKEGKEEKDWEGI